MGLPGAPCWISGFLDFWISGLQEIQNFYDNAGLNLLFLGHMMRKTGPVKDYQNESERFESLNFKVDSDFKKAFKGYAVSQGMTMVDLLKEGFVLSKKQRELS